MQIQEKYRNNLSITTNGRLLLVYGREALFKAIQQNNNHVILMKDHGDISRSI